MTTPNDFASQLRAQLAADQVQAALPQTGDAESVYVIDGIGTFPNVTAFNEAILNLEDGEELSELLQLGEWKVARRMGLVRFNNEEGGVHVPNWAQLLAHLRIVQSI